MSSKARGRAVLLDNFTLQGAYSHLVSGNQSKLSEECLAHLIESIVMYDRLCVPIDVLTINSACKYIAEQLGEIIEGGQLERTPDQHHHLINYQIVQRFTPWLAEAKPFKDIDLMNAILIERVGHPFPFTIGKIDRYVSVDFFQRNTYYAWYCVQLAGAHGLNYLPNPTRARLFDAPGIFRLPNVKNFRNDIIRYFEKVRVKHSESVSDILRSITTSFDFPLIYDYVKAQAQSPQEIFATAIDVRNSREAIAYRYFCEDLENTYQRGDLEGIDEKISEIRTLGNQWSESLVHTEARRKWSISWFIGTDFETPWFDLKAPDKKPHFAFIHSMLSKRDNEDK